MNAKYPHLCPRCEATWRASGKLDNMAVNGSSANPCDQCGTTAVRVTIFMDAAEKARFDAESEKKSNEMSQQRPR